MARRSLTFAMLLLSAALIAVCERAAAERRQPSPTPTYGPNTVHFGGVRDIRFGESVGELTARGALRTDDVPCGPLFTTLEMVAPVFADDRLVLVWVESPQRTPEGVTVGTPVAQVRAVYPRIDDLKAPPRTYRYDGMLVTEGDRAYLFLHDGVTVRKTVVGYTEYVRRLFDTGFGTC